MKRLKLFIRDNLKIIIAIAYAMAITAMVSLLLSWSKLVAILFVFTIIFELTFFVLHMESYKEDEQYKDDV